MLFGVVACDWHGTMKDEYNSRDMEYYSKFQKTFMLSGPFPWFWPFATRPSKIFIGI